MRIAVSLCVLAPLFALADPPTSQPAASQPAASQPASRPTKSYAHAADALSALDTRRPVPLIPMMAWHQKQNMQQHLQAIERIIAGAAASKWGAVMVAARTIESSPDMQQMCHHMGKGAEGFTALALDFHTRADAIRPAAQKKDLKAVLAATAHTLQACNGCHSAFRQDVVDSATWQTRTGVPAPH